MGLRVPLPLFPHKGTRRHSACAGLLCGMSTVAVCQGTASGPHIASLGAQKKALGNRCIRTRLKNHLEFRLKKRATVICRKGKRILLVARRQSKWALPGGILKRGERLSDAALRELKEETQLSGRSIKYLFDFRGKQKHHHVFYCDISERARPRPGNEISRCRWVHLGDIARLITSAPTNDIVKLASQKRKNGRTK
jgi:8-oxo-dGTP diphosphatase